MNRASQTEPKIRKTHSTNSTWTLVLDTSPGRTRWIDHRKLATFEFHHNLPFVGKHKQTKRIMSDGYESVEDEVDEVDEESEEEEEVATKKKRREKKWKVKIESSESLLVEIRM